MHFLNYPTNEGRFTACGMFSPNARKPSPYYGARMMINPLLMSTALNDVTCKRCLRSEIYRKAMAAVQVSQKRSRR